MTCCRSRRKDLNRVKSRSSYVRKGFQHGRQDYYPAGVDLEGILGKEEWAR